MVVQAALFAGFLSAFLIELLGRLEPDPIHIIQDVLIHQTQMMRNSSLGPYVPVDFSPPEYIVVVNALFYASLGVMLLAAFIAMLIKSWVREFDRGLRAMSLPEHRAKTREFRYLGMEHWKLPEMVAILPFLIQISLLLFSIGLVLFLFHVNKSSFGVILAIFGVSVLYYAMTTSISVFVTSSPFHSPLSRTLGAIYRYMHTYFCPSVAVFLSPDMDATPATALGRLRRRIQIFLQKSRPYLETEFANPIMATTVDEVHISTASSVLQRIHESVPNSQYSESLQWSVWQVAGSPALRIPPSFSLPSWILHNRQDKQFFSRLPPAMAVALVACSSRVPSTWDMNSVIAVRKALECGNAFNSRWAQLVHVIGNILLENWFPPDNLIQMRSNDLANILRWNELHGEECLWLLNTLSELHSGEWVRREEPFFIGICVAMISVQAPKWDFGNTPEIVFLEAVVALVAIACSQDTVYRRETLVNSRQNPWLLLNLRNPELISKMIEDVPSSCHKQLISLLFLVLYGLIWRDSELLAAQYFGIITAKGDFSLYASALTAVAPAIGAAGLSTFGRMLVAPQMQPLIPILYDSMWLEERIFQEELLQDYDSHLGASQIPDPNILAILVVLSKQLSPYKLKSLQNLDLKLNNPWLRLAARVVSRLDVPDVLGLDMGPFCDHRVHNMIAALSLLRYVEEVPQYRESLLLASFLKSRELSISSLALRYYLRTIISYSEPLAPSCHLPAAVRAMFNHLLPDHQLWMGWEILGIFVDGFERLPMEWRLSFAESFFTLSHQRLPRLRGDTEISTPESQLEKILTWEYFHEDEREPEHTDSDFSGWRWRGHFVYCKGVGYRWRVRQWKTLGRSIRVCPWSMRNLSSEHFPSSSKQLLTTVSFRSCLSFACLSSGSVTMSCLNTIA